MILQSAFRSVIAPDALRYIALKQALGLSSENATSVLQNLDDFLLGKLKTAADLTPQTFKKWGQTLEPLSPNTRLARMQIVRNLCIHRRRASPNCFVPDPHQFPKACPRLRPHIFSEVEVARQHVQRSESRRRRRSYESRVIREQSAREQISEKATGASRSRDAGELAPSRTRAHEIRSTSGSGANTV